MKRIKLKARRKEKCTINQKERDSCPKCGSIRIAKKLRYYICYKCKWTGDNPKKVMWYFGIPYRGDGPSVGRIINPAARDRNSCPSCNSIRVSKRIHTRDYRCGNCGWIGDNPIRMKWGVLDKK